MPASRIITSPIDGRSLGRVSQASRREVDRAFSRLSRAQADWAQQSLPVRLKIVRQLANVLRENKKALANRIVKEIGKTPGEAISEVDRTVELIQETAKEAARLKPYQIRSEDGPGHRTGRVQTVSRVPFGVVVAISPFNYPINLSFSKIAPALAMGNTVLWKPSTAGSVLARWIVGRLRAAGFPQDLLQIVTGSGGQIGDHLVSHPECQMVAMTGSVAVGQRIAAQTGPIPLLLELGGNDPALVLADADLKKAAQHIAGGAFKLSGQRCTAIKRVYAVRSAADHFVKQLVDETERSFGSVGDPREHPIGPVINRDQARYLQQLIREAVRRGAKIIHGGTVSGRLVQPTILDRVPANARVVQKEQFGPVLPIVRVRDAAEAVRRANETEFGLQAAVYTRNQRRAQQLADELKVGGVHLNGPDQRAPDNFLFIGHKASGLGAQGVRFALENMSQPKGVVTNRQ